MLRRSCADDTTLLRDAEDLLARDTAMFEEVAEFARGRLNQNEHNRIGERIGAYAIIRELGRGGMGAVYLAKRADGQFQKLVAIKILKRGTDTDEVLRRFRVERQILANLDHSNITRLLDAGITGDGLPYFVMEFIEGTPITRFVQRENLDLRGRLELFLKVCSAVDLAHRNLIIHRDIKPGNVLVKKDGEPKLLDFGIAKLLNSGDDGDITVAVERRLTPTYAAPEQAAGKSVTIATDVYSLGALLYELLTNQPPPCPPLPTDFPLEHASTPNSSQERLPSPVDSDPGVKQEVEGQLDRIVKRAMEQEPVKRYPSVADLASDVEQYLNGKATSTASRARLEGPGKRAKTRLVATGAACLLFGAAVIWLFRGELARMPLERPEKSIAVLPFRDLSQASDQEYFCDGISEEILDALAKIDGMRVVARTSSFSFKGKNANASKIGKKLNVNHLLEGSMQREGNHIRISVELIDTRSGFRVWSETYERELEGVLALQDEITRSIVNALKMKLAVSLPAREQRNTEAYDLYLQGLFFSNKSSEEDLRRALSFLQRALEKDPTFSRAWTGIAKVWYFLADVYVKPLEAYPASKEAALKAIALDEKDAEAHCYLSEARRVLDWDLVGEEAELKRALELDPNSAPAHFFLALLPLFRGEPKEGLRLVLEAEKLDPVSPITSYVATAAYLANNRIDDAIIEGQRTLQLDPNYFYLDSTLAAAYREKGNFAEGIALYLKAQEVTHFPSSGLAITYTRMGQQLEAQNILAELLQEREKRYVSAPLIAAVYVAFGDNEEAFRWLERAFAEHSAILQWIAVLPEFRPLHSDTRFPHLLRRIGGSQNSILAITETTLSETADPNAQSHFTLKIGVKPRLGTQNGHTVRINVSFYDLAKDNKMKPTDARTGYNWLTSASDWTDATPKFLAATYVRPKTQTPSTEGRRYGGFIVRVYFDGQLQDSRATPPELLRLFPEDEPVYPPKAAPSPRP